MHEYYFGPLRLRTDLELPELCPIASAEGPRTSSTCDIEAVSGDFDHDMVFDHIDTHEGVVFMERSFHDGGITLRLDGAVDYTISPDFGHITIRPNDTIAASSVRHNLIDQVLPRVLDGLDRFVLHASGVETSSGGALFLGDSGTGKSSLAAEFGRTGSRLLGDDCFILDAAGTALTAQSTYPSLRLLPDSIDYLFEDTTIGLSEVSPDRSKQRIDQERREPPAPAPISCMFIIDLTMDHQGPPEAVPLRSRNAMLHLVKNSFRLDPSPLGAHRALSQAEAITKLAPMYELRYERRYSELSKVLAAVRSTNELATSVG